MSGSFTEKSVWVQLVVMLGGLGLYATAALRIYNNAVYDMGAYVPLMIGAVIGLVVLLAVAHALVAAIGGAEDRDERDRMIAWKAAYRSSWVGSLGAMVAVLCLVQGLEPVIATHVLIVSLGFSHVVDMGLRLVAYRMGA
ncbi:hypothetical protein [Mucisphaera sp.]|uniref:hypothetical protein n=1 Tax=Mucisphaera sp. TaxID=2913024 RepID=UPI003D1295F2